MQSVHINTSNDIFLKIFYFKMFSVSLALVGTLIFIVFFLRIESIKNHSILLKLSRRVLFYLIVSYLFARHFLYDAHTRLYFS